MISVEFKAIRTAACIWCGKEKTTYDVAFSDKSFVGPLCRNDLLRAISSKCNGKPDTPLLQAAPAK